MLKETKLKTKKKEPLHPFLMLIVIMIIVGIGAYFIPAGEYTRVPGPAGHMVIDPTSFHFVEQPSFRFINLLTAIPRGFVEASSVIIALLMIGGAFNVINKIGIIEAGVKLLIRKFSKHKIIIIPVLFTVFAVIITFIGNIEMCLVFIPIIMPLLLTLGYDSMTTVGIALFSTLAGFTSGLTNPYTVGIGQTLAELPMYSGMGFRAVTLIVTVITGCIYIMIYALKIQKDPLKSYTYENDITLKQELAEKGYQGDVKVTWRQRLAGAVTIIVFIGLICGIISQNWGLVEMAGYFILLGAIPGFIIGMTPSEIAKSFTEGFKDILEAAFMCGIARGIAAVMSDALVMDTVIYYLSGIVTALPKQLCSIGMMVVVFLFDGFVSSGSGKAFITMPIMLPLADLADFTRQTAILAYQFGDGICNVVWPTSGYFMAAIAMGKVSYSKWIKFALPLLIIWLIEYSGFLIIADLIQYGPF